MGSKFEHRGEPARGNRRSSTTTLLDAAPTADRTSAQPSIRAELGAALERQLLISGTKEPRGLAPQRPWLRTLALALAAFSLALGGAYLWHRGEQGRWEEEKASLQLSIESVENARSELRESHRVAQTELEAKKRRLVAEIAAGERLAQQVATQSEEIAGKTAALQALAGEKAELENAVARLRGERLGQIGERLAAIARQSWSLIARLRGRASPRAPTTRDNAEQLRPVAAAAPFASAPAPATTTTLDDEQEPLSLEHDPVAAADASRSPARRDP